MASSYVASNRSFVFFVMGIGISKRLIHYNDVVMGAMASQIISITIVYSTVYSRHRSRKNQSSAALAFVRGIHRGPVNFPHKRPVTRKISSFDDVIMCTLETEKVRSRFLSEILCFSWELTLSFSIMIAHDVVRNTNFNFSICKKKFTSFSLLE